MLVGYAGVIVRPGAIIANKYEVSGAPVRGGMGDVHPARRLADNTAVALKLLREELRDLPEALERFRREAVAAKRIHSEHVAQVYEVLDDPDLGLVIVFEFLDGESLEDLLKRERYLALERAHPIVCQILQGLADAHAVPVVHRDLKPPNIFLQRTGKGPPQVKLVDFGISKVPQELAGPVLTKAGQNLGSFSYMAPEQASSPSGVDQRADLYACGTVVFRMLTGQLPYVATSVGELIGKKSRQPARKLAEALPTAHPPFTPELEAWVARMLDRNPAGRFSTAWEALEAWEALAPGPRKAEGKVAQPMPAHAPPQRPMAPPRPPADRASAPRPAQPPARSGEEQVSPVRPGPTGPARPAATVRSGPAPRVARAKTMLGMGPNAASPPPLGPPAEPPRKHPSVPTRVERPQSTAEPMPSAPRPAAGQPSSPLAKPQGPVSLPRKPPPPPKRSFEDEEPDEDDAPTAMFVHASPMTYDPNGPPVPSPAAGAPAAPPSPAPASQDLIDDGDYSEPPTAIHVPAYRPDEVPAAPPIPSEFRGGAQAAAAAAPAPVAAVPSPISPAFRPPGVEPAPAPVPTALAPVAQPTPAAAGAVQGIATPQQPIQTGPFDQPPSPSHPSRVMPPNPPYGLMPMEDPDAAPTWLQAIAISTVVSAVTVLGVLGWMVLRRF